jgi:hypothetical protein
LRLQPQRLRLGVREIWRREQRLASATLGTCSPDLGTTQSFITLGSLSGSPVLFTLPFTVAPYNSLNVSVRFGKITFGGQVHTVKQTSW